MVPFKVGTVNSSHFAQETVLVMSKYHNTAYEMKETDKNCKKKKVTIINIVQVSQLSYSAVKRYIKHVYVVVKNIKLQLL